MNGAAEALVWIGMMLLILGGVPLALKQYSAAAAMYVVSGVALVAGAVIQLWVNLSPLFV